MLIDSRELDEGSVLQCDICIVGGGAAGITIAREFARAKHSVILLESGGLRFEKPTQALYEGVATGNAFADASRYLETSRLRYFGGSTNHWAGYCRPLESLDFERRSWVAASGWPLSADDLADYYRRALPILDLPSFDYEIEREFSPGRAPLKWQVGASIRTAMIHFSKPTRFGVAFRDDLKNAENIRVLLHGNALELVTEPGADRVVRVDARCLSGSAFSVGAKIFVLATGGIENARMLLLSNGVHAQGLGNQHDQVGRYFMEHLAMRGGDVILTVPASSAALYMRRMDPLRRHVSLGLFSTTASAQRERSLLAFTARVLSARPKKVAPDRRNFIEAIRQIDSISDPSSASDTVVYGRLRVVSEQAPNPASRVTLSGEVDRLGLQKTHLDWQVQTSDYDSVHDSLRLLARELGRISRGRIRLGVSRGESELRPRNNGGNHHIGTTRMHANPRAGVVDANCRVHGVPNLFVAGSSVFPTGGAEGTTTLTIVALALRLADELKKDLAK